MAYCAVTADTDERGRTGMAQVKVFCEPELALLTVFWQAPRADQVASELDDGLILIKDATTGEPIGVEVLS
jgi:hypothetical protein